MDNLYSTGLEKSRLDFDDCVESSATSSTGGAPFAGGACLAPPLAGGAPFPPAPAAAATGTFARAISRSSSVTFFLSFHT